MIKLFIWNQYRDSLEDFGYAWNRIISRYQKSSNETIWNAVGSNARREVHEIWWSYNFKNTKEREKEVVHNNNNNNNMLMLQSHKVIFSTPHHILILQHIRATLSVYYNFSTVLDLLDEILNYIFLTHKYIDRR